MNTENRFLETKIDNVLLSRLLPEGNLYQAEAEEVELFIQPSFVAGKVRDAARLGLHCPELVHVSAVDHEQQIGQTLATIEPLVGEELTEVVHLTRC